jgi:hypothetical protein
MLGLSSVLTYQQHGQVVAVVAERGQLRHQHLIPVQVSFFFDVYALMALLAAQHYLPPSENFSFHFCLLLPVLLSLLQTSFLN